MPIWLKDWWPLIVLLVPLTIAAAGWVIRMGLASRRDMEAGLAAVAVTIAAEAKARSEALAKLDEKVSQGLSSVDRRLIQVETDIRHLPTAEDMTELKDSMAEIGAQGRHTAKDVETISKSVTRIEDHLMKGAST